MATYKAILRPILNYAAPICFTQISSTHQDKLEVIQNKAQRIATGCHQKAAASHLRVETGVLPLRVHLELPAVLCQSPPTPTPESPSQTPPPGPDDRGDHPVTGAQQGAYAPSPPIDLAELLPRSYHSAVCHSIGWADDPKCTDCRSTYRTMAHLSLATSGTTSSS